MKRLLVVWIAFFCLMISLYCPLAWAERVYDHTRVCNLGEQNNTITILNVKQYVSASGYSPVEAKYEAFVREDDGLSEPVSIQFWFTFNIQGRDLSIRVDLTPKHPAWNELKDVRVYDWIWLHVDEDGKVLDIRKKEPGKP